MKISIPDLKALKSFRFNQDFLKDKKIQIGGMALALIVLIIIAVSFGGNKNPAKPDLPRTVAAFGTLPSLEEAANENDVLQGRLNQLYAFDIGYLFANYQAVNKEVAEILFLWAGMPPELLPTAEPRKSVETFLRRVYGLPKDEPIVNNPVVGQNAWAKAFNRFKARLLMLGEGYKIYKGTAYYDPSSDKMVITPTAEISKDFFDPFADFVNNLPEKQRQSTANNFLVFVNETKGLENLSDKEKKMIEKIR